MIFVLLIELRVITAEELPLPSTNTLQMMIVEMKGTNNIFYIKRLTHHIPTHFKKSLNYSFPKNRNEDIVFKKASVTFTFILRACKAKQRIHTRTIYSKSVHFLS
ncbi:hypothetical protein BrL25_05800 [Brevibacillus laterosporus DSM 25]|nr:hypothetical protein BrL25_05800 [Brevibacillus laterosporus DSM 25]